MKKFTTLLLAILLVLPAMAVNMTGGEILYLTPGTWNVDGARFAMYLCNGSSDAVWIDMTKVDGKDIYTATVPSGDYKNVIFCRMNPSTPENNWDNKWNQTVNLTYDGTNNCYNVTGWGESDGNWSVYGEELVIPVGELSFNEGEYVVFFVNTKGWNSVNAYVWTDASSEATWPGAAMTKTDVKVNGKYDVYKYKASREYKNLIFNNGSDQTPDLVFTNGGVYDGNGEKLTTIEATEVVVPTINVYYSPTTVFVNDVVTFTAETLNADGLTVQFYINGEEVENTWTPTVAGTYTLTADLLDGNTVKATAEAKEIVVKEDTFTVYLKKFGAWETTYIYLWGDASNSWPGEAMETTTVDGIDYFYHTFNRVGTVNIIFNNGAGNQTADITGVTGEKFYELVENEGNYNVKDVTIYDANITAGFYYLTPGAWESDRAWFAMYLFDMNNGKPSTWVKGWLTNHNVAFEYEGETAYTHMIFCRMNPEFDVLAWDEYDGETLVADRVWNQTGDIIYEVPEEGYVTSYYITSLVDPCEGEWRQELLTATGLDRVELADGIGYAYGVVSAEGAIEVYNVNGAVVARGNDNVDLRGLGRGVYIIRNGNQVRKVVR